MQKLFTMLFASCWTRKIRYLFIVALFLLMPVYSWAVGQVNAAEIIQVRVDRSGKGYIKFNSSLINTPAACIQSGYENVLAFNTNEPGGRAILSLALSAHASGKKINANGTGACAVYGVIEDWDWGYAR